MKKLLTLLSCLLLLCSCAAAEQDAPQALTQGRGK